MNPNFFIVGASKSGTTNISYYLNEHPDVFISELNEPYYFSRLDVSKNFKRESMITDYEADKWINAQGPKVLYKMIKHHVDKGNV